jgi:branched-subunit amino acid ABC-type transport system permease component
VGLVLAFPVMLLWNFVFGSVYSIGVLQAWALNVLAGILFGQKTARQ